MPWKCILYFFVVVEVSQCFSSVDDRHPTSSERVFCPDKKESRGNSSSTVASAAEAEAEPSP
jgi:hypothetical protein